MPTCLERIPEGRVYRPAFGAAAHSGLAPCSRSAILPRNVAVERTAGTFAPALSISRGHFFATDACVPIYRCSHCDTTSDVRLGIEPSSAMTEAGQSILNSHTLSERSSGRGQLGDCGPKTQSRSGIQMRSSYVIPCSLGSIALTLLGGAGSAQAIQVYNCTSVQTSILNDNWAQAVANTGQAWRDLVDSPQARESMDPRAIQALGSYSSDDYWTLTDNLLTLWNALQIKNIAFDCNASASLCSGQNAYVDPTNADGTHRIYVCPYVNTATPSYWNLLAAHRPSVIVEQLSRFNDVLATNGNLVTPGIKNAHTYRTFLDWSLPDDYVPTAGGPSINQFSYSGTAAPNSKVYVTAACPPLYYANPSTPELPLLVGVDFSVSPGLVVYSSRSSGSSWMVRAFNPGTSTGTLTVTANCLIGLPSPTNSGTTSSAVLTNKTPAASLSGDHPCPAGSFATGEGYALMDATAPDDTPALNALIYELRPGVVIAKKTDTGHDVSLYAYSNCMNDGGFAKWVKYTSAYARQNSETWDACPSGTLAVSSGFRVGTLTQTTPVPQPLIVLTARDFGTEKYWSYFKSTAPANANLSNVTSLLSCVSYTN